MFILQKKSGISIVHSDPANIVLSSNNTDVFVGDTVYLTCVGYGDPPLSVGWLRGDRELSNGSRVTVYEEERETEGGERFITSVLEVCSVTQSDAGEYSCVATNGRGNSSAKIELLLSSPSKFVAFVKGVKNYYNFFRSCRNRSLLQQH